jgi:hypothetical protein
MALYSHDEDNIPFINARGRTAHPEFKKRVEPDIRKKIDPQTVDISIDIGILTADI